MLVAFLLLSVILLKKPDCENGVISRFQDSLLRYLPQGFFYRVGVMFFVKRGVSLNEWDKKEI